MMTRWLEACVLAFAMGGTGATTHAAPPRLRRTTPSVKIGAGVYRPMFPAAPSEGTVQVQPFWLDVTPVTNHEFLVFVRAFPRWRRDRVSPLFVDTHYLSHWRGPLEPGEAGPTQPVTRVSWFAAKAFCEAHGQRLPTEREWEHAAAASATQPDGDLDPAWRAQVLTWYQTPTGTLPVVGKTVANVWGIQDLHGVVWEWVYDFNAALVAIDSREKSDGDRGRFCGGGAAYASDTTDYAEFMRLAYRSSLEASYGAANLGFRCARDLKPRPKELR